MALPVKFGVSTWLWTSPFSNDSIDPLLSMIAEMGFDAVEIAVEDPFLFDAKKVKRAMEKYNLAAVVCGAFGPSRASNQGGHGGHGGKPFGSVLRALSDLRGSSAEHKLSASPRLRGGQPKSQP